MQEITKKESTYEEELIREKNFHALLNVCKCSSTANTIREKDKEK